MSGRSGNDIASGLMVILDNVVNDNPTVAEITLWSDSCVPQNRNKVMTAALQIFLQTHPSVKTITHKYCEPGHSEIQEVDNLHSQIEKVVLAGEVYSPMGLVRILKRVPRHKPLKLKQLRREDMKDYHAEADTFVYNKIPYTQVKTLQYSADDIMCVRYKTAFSADTWNDERICSVCNKRSNVQAAAAVATSGNSEIRNQGLLRMPTSLTKMQCLSAEKVKDSSSMFAYMPASDRMYMQTLLKNTSPQNSTNSKTATNCKCKLKKKAKTKTKKKAKVNSKAKNEVT